MRNEVFSCTKTEGNGVFSVVPFRVVSSALVAPPMWIPCACSRAPAPPALAKLPAARAQTRQPPRLIWSAAKLQASHTRPASACASSLHVPDPRRTYPLMCSHMQMLILERVTSNLVVVIRNGHGHNLDLFCIYLEPSQSTSLPLDSVESCWN